MPRGEAAEPQAAQKLPLLYILATLTLITAFLYFAKAVLMPVALAILLAFLLSPLVLALQRWGLGRIPAVILVVVLTFSLLGALGWTVFRQFASLTDDLPRYQQNIKHKIADIQGAGQDSFLDKAQKTITEITQELQRSDRPLKPEDQPIPVVVQGPSVLWQLPAVLELLATAGLVIALVIFMLLARGDLRNRLIRLVGYRRLTLATKALEEAEQRISRYLLMHSIVNGSYGTVLGLGLFLIGLPYALLWGVLAALFRFIPYLGPAIATLFPAAFSLVAFPAWQEPLLVIGLIVLLELGSNMIMEPLLYGRTAGVSEVSLMIAIAFWTWLWGPVGLLLATPLTVSLGVLGRYVPQLEFLGVLLSDEPVLEPHTSYYQRLVARDQDEATDLVEEYLQTHTVAELYDNVLVRALYRTRNDWSLGNLTQEDMHFVVHTTREIVENVGGSQQLPVSAEDADATALEPQPGRILPDKTPVVCYPARDEIDEVALFLLLQLLDPERYIVELVPATLLAAEVVTLMEQKQGGLFCIGVIGPGGVSQARYHCKRLRARIPTLKIVIGHWGVPDSSAVGDNLLRITGVDAVGTSLQETLGQIMQFESVVQSVLPEALKTPG